MGEVRIAGDRREWHCIRNTSVSGESMSPKTALSSMRSFGPPGSKPANECFQTALVTTQLPVQSRHRRSVAAQSGERAPVLCFRSITSTCPRTVSRHPRASCYCHRAFGDHRAPERVGSILGWLGRCAIGQRRRHHPPVRLAHFVGRQGPTWDGFTFPT